MNKLIETLVSLNLSSADTKIMDTMTHTSNMTFIIMTG